MNPRLAHLVGLLAIIGPQLAVVWQDQQASTANKIAMSVVTLLTLVLTDPKKHATAVTLIRAGIAVAALVVSAILTKGTLGTVGTSVATTAIAVFVRLQALLPATPAVVPADDTPTQPLGPGPKAAAVLLLTGSLLLAGSARADTPISKCWTSICIGPQVAATTFTLRLDTKAFSAQIPTGAAGYGFNLPSGYLSGGMFLTGQLGTKATPQFIGTALLLTVMRAVVIGPVYHYGDDGEWFGVALGGSLTSTFGLEAPPKGNP